MMTSHSRIISKRDIHQGLCSCAFMIETIDSESVVLVCTLGAAVHFFSDLSRMLEKDHTYEFWQPKKEMIDIDQEKTYVFIDTVYDTGATFKKIPHLENVFKMCLISKHPKPDLDFYAMSTERDKFLYGYGLDLDGKYRNLEEIFYV